MPDHGERRSDRFTDLGWFLEIHVVNEVRISWLPLGSRFFAEARCGMYLAQSEGFSGSPENAIKQAVLRVRVMAGHQEELAERPEEFYGPKSGLPKEPQCLLCLRKEREEAQRPHIGAAV